MEKSCGQECVDWAIGLLESGRDSHYLRLLIGMSAPFNHFEVASYRDGLLRELGLDQCEPANCVCEYAGELMKKALDGELEIIPTLSEISELHVSNGYLNCIRDFYYLWWAYQDLQCGDSQWYWHGATLENIDSVIRTRMLEYVDDRKLERDSP